MTDQFRLELPEPDPDEALPEVEPLPSPFPQQRSPATDHQEQAGPGGAGQAAPNSNAPVPVYSDADEVWLQETQRESTEYKQISLAEMMLATAVLAVVLTLGRFFPLAALAGSLGCLVLVGLGFLLAQQPPRWVYLLWWTLLVAYLFSACWTYLARA